MRNYNELFSHEVTVSVQRKKLYDVQVTTRIQTDPRCEIIILT